MTLPLARLTIRHPFPPPPIRPEREDYRAADISSDTVQKYQHDHSYDFIDESLFDGIPLTRRRVHEWGFAIQDQGASQNTEDDPVLQDFRSAFVPDLETPVDCASVMPPPEKYVADGDVVIHSFAAHDRGDAPPAPEPEPYAYPTTPLSISSTELDSFTSTSSNTVSPPRTDAGSSTSSTDEPRFAPSPGDTWVREQFVDVHEMLKRMDKPDPIKIAVMDTGCDLNAPHFLRFPKDRQRIIWQDFIENVQVSVDEDGTDDRVGHGTLVVSLLLNLLPFAQVAVCKVLKDMDMRGREVAKVRLSVGPLRQAKQTW
ncbi:hypothetical protein CSOJ01_15188 [Colletotrichum sojae]|uniref:Peptidase S8/S53 domain-containing protein n=1 Tax=Colletotrichum sojae TaxID=2175907 RepID=A0A8H6MIG2_9PEZI|nr:hypothetical protein CSOJ01_15188 [Colletotrichum sojae]